MGWTTPRTWGAGELVRVRYFRTDVADNFAYLKRTRTRLAFFHPMTIYHPGAGVIRPGTPPNDYFAIELTEGDIVYTKWAVPPNIDTTKAPIAYRWWAPSTTIPSSYVVRYTWRWLYVADGASLLGTMSSENGSDGTGVTGLSLYKSSRTESIGLEGSIQELTGVVADSLLKLSLDAYDFALPIGTERIHLLGLGVEWGEAI